jgi:hypothetical protein
MSNDPFDLDQLQRWMQAVIVHPQGVSVGVASPEAQRHLALDLEGIETVIAPSQSQSSAERLAIYSQAYYARLLECLRAEFPVLCEAIGQDLFDRFAVGYLQSHPSRSYTLGLLGANFAAYLRDTRPKSDDTGWPDFLIDLATLEWNFSEVFDGPGVEGQPLLDAREMQSLPAELWPEARLVPVPCLRLIALEYPVQQLYRAIRQRQPAAPCEPRATWLAISRREFVVRHYELTCPQYQLLSDVLAGRCVGDAICRAADSVPGDFDAFARDLQAWFQLWTAEGFFLGVELPRVR